MHNRILVGGLSWSGKSVKLLPDVPKTKLSPFRLSSKVHYTIKASHRCVFELKIVVRFSFGIKSTVTIRELRLALQDEWAAMPQQLIDTLILSMGRRCKTCLAVRGDHIHY
ncbi:hypothetical protein TNCV_3360451 [Trichonephila clavipes]|nr:hypothetical protein TNCV_3360451 [Trichonephila clavipes]